MKIDIGLKDLTLIAPMIVLFVMSLVPLTFKVLRGNREQNPTMTLMWGFAGLIIAGGSLLVVTTLADGILAFNKTLLFDSITQWMGIVALISVGISMVFMFENPSTKGEQFSELVFLTMSSALGMLILASAIDLLMVFIGLEMMSLSLYLMIGMGHEQKLSKEAAFKYFVLGSFASAVFLFGVAYIFGTTGTTNILDFLEQAPALMQTNRLFLIGTALTIIGFCFKVSIVPFHAWTPDVYQGAPTPHTAFMATAVKTVSFAAFLRIIATKSLIGSESLFNILQWLAVITMLVGNFGAIIQNNLKRMLAYSSISHSGYILVGLIAAGTSDEGSFGASGVIFYLLAYAVMTLGSFALVSIMEKNENSIIHVDDLAGLAKSRPVLALCFSIFMFSLAGLPPTVGFFSKFYLFSAALKEGLLWLTVWGVVNSVISVYYYLRPVVVMYMKEGDAEVAPHPQTATVTTLVVTALFVTFMGIFSGPLFEAMEKSFL